MCSASSRAAVSTSLPASEAAPRAWSSATKAGHRAASATRNACTPARMTSSCVLLVGQAQLLGALARFALCPGPVRLRLRQARPHSRDVLGEPQLLGVQAGERTVRIAQGLVGWHAPQLVLQLLTALAQALAIAGQLIETPLRLCALLLQLGQPCAPRHLAGAATDERRCGLAPGATQSAVAKLALRRDPDRAVVLRQRDRGEHATHGLQRTCPRGRRHGRSRARARRAGARHSLDLARRA